MKQPGYHLVLPMAGAGSRFAKLGFNQPKPLLPLFGKPAFYWAARSLLAHTTPASITAVVLQKHVDEWKLDAELKAYFPDIKLVVLPEVTSGATMTCLAAVPHVANDAPVAFMDCDLAFQSIDLNTLDANPAKLQRFTESAGMLMTFASDNPAYSYAVEGDNGLVTRTAEKQVVSPHAIAGCYWFRNVETFQKAADAYILNCPYNEYFMSGVFNTLLEQGQMVTRLGLDYHLSFGTPDEYKAVQTRPEWSKPEWEGAGA